MKEMIKQIRNLWEYGLGILYPQTCCFCGKVSKSAICSECFKQIEYVKEPRCKKCGKPIRTEEAEFCADCEKEPKHYESGRSVWLHQGVVAQSIYQFKYGNRRVYAKTYANEMYRLYGEKIKEWGIEVIIPVPLHRKRRRKRGYNQAEVLARELSRLCNIPVDTRSVCRFKNTTPQKLLSHNERKQNMRKAFRVKKDWEIPKNLLLIDDIYTTGNTIDELAQILKKKGALNVFFLTISIGQGF